MKRWTNREINYLKKNYSTNLDKNLSKKLSRSLGSISYIAYKLKLKKDRDFYCKARKKTKINFTKELIIRLYIKEKKSTRKIASELKVGKTTIEHYFKKFKIPMRSHSAANKVRFLSESTWTKGLSKKTDPRIRKLAKRVKETYKKKRELKFKKIEEKFGKSIKDIINELYWKSNLTQEKIAVRLDLSREMIIYLMKKFEITKRLNYEYISSLKGKNHPLYGKTWESLLGKKKADKRRKEYSNRFRKLTIRRLENNEFPFFDTKIEKIMARELLKRKMSFVEQFRIANKFVCDFAIPSFNIIIECDGDYWHANPKIYDSNKLTYTQKKKVKIDKIKDKLLDKKGWIVLRFFESDIKSNISNCVDEIEKAIKSRSQEYKKSRK